jgi:hypothetical protein
MRCFEGHVKEMPIIPRLAGKCVLKLVETIWEVPKGYWSLFGKFPKSIGDLFSNLYRIADTLWEMPK